MSISIDTDLRSKFGPVRNQKSRPTCIAFAASDAHAAQRTSPFEPLSVEYAYYHACLKRAAFDPHSGVAMPDILAAIEIDGQPAENDWLYLDQLPTDISSYKPPTAIGMVYRRDTQQESRFSVIVSMLDQGSAPLIAMNISLEFFAAKADQVLRAPLASPTAARHGLVVVGNGEEQNEPVLLIRNSWGDRWADHGHAWISRGYLEPRLLSVGVMEL